MGTHLDDGFFFWKLQNEDLSRYRVSSRCGHHLDRILLLDGGSSKWGLLLDGPPVLIQMEPPNFPNLKASIWKLEILQNFKGFGPFLVKIRAVAFLWDIHGGSSRCGYHLESILLLDGDSSRWWLLHLKASEWRPLDIGPDEDPKP